MEDKILFHITIEDANVIAEDILGRNLIQEELDELEIILYEKLEWGKLIEEFVKNLRF